MAFKDCFYLQFLKDDAPGIDFVESDFAGRPPELTPNLYYGYEKPDNSEPDWVKIGFGDGEARHIDVTIGQKIYFKGTMPISISTYRGGTIPTFDYSANWFNLGVKAPSTYLKMGGCPLSMMHDGDGSRDLPPLPPFNEYYPSFYELGAGFPGHLNIGDIIFPTNTLNSAGLFIYCFVNTKYIEGTHPHLFPKHKLGHFEYATMFQSANILGSIWLPYSDDDLAKRCFYAMFIHGTVRSIHVNFTTWNGSSDSPTRNWVPSNGDGSFFCPSALPDYRGGFYIQNGWQYRPMNAVSAGFAATHKLGGRKF